MEQKKDFTSLEEAFAALSEPLREHSLRVEKYAEMIFLELCAAEEYTLNIRSRVRLRTENRTLIATAARYHDIGKVLVPEYYQWDDPDYPPEEQALYRRHAPAGEELIYRILQDQKGVVPMTVAILCESINSHHESWDGSGFPSGSSEENIPAVGRIVGVADALDHLLMTTRTETPVQTAIDLMMEDSGSQFDPVIMGLLYDAKHKVEKIFAQYREDSLALPVATRIIRRKAKRPMWLDYRPVYDLQTQSIVALEGQMRFRRGKETVGYAEAEPLLKKSKLIWDAGFCFVIEACDAARRMKTCGVCGEYVALNLVPGFLKKRGTATAIAKMLAESESDPASLCLILQQEDATEPSPAVLENLDKLRALGCTLMVSGLPLETLDLPTLAAIGVSRVRLSAEDSERAEELAEKLQILANSGISVLGDGVEKHRTIGALTAAGVCHATGDLLGEYATEDTWILGELALQTS